MEELGKQLGNKIGGKTGGKIGGFIGEQVGDVTHQNYWDLGETLGDFIYNYKNNGFQHAIENIHVNKENKCIKIGDWIGDKLFDILN